MRRRARGQQSKQYGRYYRQHLHLKLLTAGELDGSVVAMPMAKRRSCKIANNLRTPGMTVGDTAHRLLFWQVLALLRRRGRQQLLEHVGTIQPPVLVAGPLRHWPGLVVGIRSLEAIRPFIPLFRPWLLEFALTRPEECADHDE